MQTALPQEFDAETVTLVTPMLNVEPLPSPDPLEMVAPVKVYEITGEGNPLAVTL